MKNSEKTDYKCLLKLSTTVENRKITEVELTNLCRLIENPDRGVVDAVSKLLRKHPEPSAAEFLVHYTESGDPALRNLAGDILLKMGEVSVDPVLGFLEKNSNDDTLKFLIDILGLIGSAKAGDFIIKVMNSSRNDNVVIACIEALGNIRYKDAVPALKSVYSRNELYTYVVIEALGKIGIQGSITFIMGNYECADELTRFSIIESLANIGDEETLSFLLSEMEKYEGAMLWVLINSVCRLKEKYNPDIRGNDILRKALLQTISEANVPYKIAAVKLADDFDDPEINSACMKIYGIDPELDSILTERFEKIPYETLKLIAGILKERECNVKALLLLAIEIVISFTADEFSGGPLGDLTGSASLYISSPDEEVRKLVYEIMLTYNPDLALRFIDIIMEDENPWNQLTVLDLIENIRRPEVNKLLEKYSSSPDEMIRERALYLMNGRSINPVINN